MRHNREMEDGSGHHGLHPTNVELREEARQEHADKCVIAVKAIGGDPATVAELVSALERSLSWLSSYPGGNAMNCYLQARAVLAKLPKENSND